MARLSILFRVPARNLLARLSTAVVVALLAPGAVLAQTPVPWTEKVQKALARSRPVLLKKLASAHGGELALLCLAAVHDGVPPDNKVFGRAIARLAKAKLGRTYDLGLRLMVAAEFSGFPNREAGARRDCRRIQAAIRKGAGFGYSSRPKNWDLSNTQYGVLGLRAAESLGQKCSVRLWRRLLVGALSAQNGDSGGFAYHPGGRGPTVSMTAAGIAVVQICADHLSDREVKALRVERRLDAAWNFLAENKAKIGGKDTRNSFYFHYGLERACILSDVEDIDGKPWYRSGAEMLLRTQLRGGGWNSPVDHIQGGVDADGSDSVSTSFAILFLRRKFRKTLGPITPGGGMTIPRLTAQSTAADIAVAVADGVRRGTAGLPAVLRGLRSAIKPQRVAALKVLIQVAGQDFGFNPHLPPAESSAAATKAERWWFQQRRAQAKGGAKESPKRRVP